MFASMPLPTSAAFNEVDVSDKPVGIRNRPLLTPTRINAIRENYQQRLESLLAVDEGVAQIVQALQTTGQLDDTYVVYTSDNGFFHGEHRVPNGKVLLYEPSIRVPLVVRGPGIPAGEHRSQLVANIDLAPTIVALTRAQPARVMDGRSLLPFARNRLLYSGRDLLLETPTYAAIRTPRWLYAEYVNGEQELYDLLRDPSELVSHHADFAYARIKADLAQRLARLRACTGAICRSGPELSLRVVYRRGGGPRRVCGRRTVRAVVTGPSARRVAQTRFYLDGRLLRRDMRAPFRVIVPRGLVRSGGSMLDAVVTLADSRVQTLSRRLSACR
jgi:hypothetical protein